MTKYPVVCMGWCLTSQSMFVNENEPPQKVVVIDSDEAKKAGWTTTLNKRFSCYGEAVWLCPKCSKRCHDENKEFIDSILSYKRKLLDEFVKCDNFERKDEIRNVVIPALTKDFANFDPTEHDWNKYYSIG